MLKRRISLILLFCFSLLLIPPRYWHECQENHVKKDLSDESFAEFEHDDCFICDFHFFTSDICKPYQLTFEKVNTPTLFKLNTSFSKVGILEQKERGPPRS